MEVKVFFSVLAGFLWAAMAFLFIWDAIIAILGLLRLKRVKKRSVPFVFSPKHRFAILIPAHNEARVISHLLDSLLRQNYPKELYRVYVADDRSSDGTAEIAKSMGACVISRNQGRPGKTWNIRDALQKIELSNWDALIILDADNLVELDFLRKLDAFLQENPEAQVIQTYLDVKNPRDGWIARAMTISYWVTNSLWQEARNALNLSSTLGGTGMCFRTAYIKDRGWKARSLTEDLEMHAEIVANGGRVFWCHSARVFDEKPRAFRVSYRQRVRWYQGHFWVSVHYAVPLLRTIFLGKPGQRLRAFDAFLYLLAPWRNLILLPMYLLMLLGGSTIILILSIFGIVLFSGAIASKARFGTVKAEWLKSSWTVFPYALTWFPVALVALWKSRDQSVWAKTSHHSSLSIEQIMGEIEIH